MGIGSDVIDLVGWLKRGRYLPDQPFLMEIGAQQLANSFLQSGSAIAALGKLFGRQRPFELQAPQSTHVIHGNLEHLAEAAPRSRDFWLWLGFEYASIDIDGSPGSLALDLNCDHTPAAHVGKYHLVTNFGTTEHIANQLNAFKVIHELTTHQGVMVHSVPAQGYFNHGLVNYNPKFFWMLARSNGYKFLSADFRTSDASYGLPQNIIDHVQGFDASIASRSENYRAVDASVFVVMQKVFDIPFVPPIDVPTGTKTNITALEERYWTVFQEGAFERMKPARRR